MSTTTLRHFCFMPFYKTVLTFTFLIDSDPWNSLSLWALDCLTLSRHVIHTNEIPAARAVALESPLLHASHVLRCLNNIHPVSFTQCSKDCGGGIKSREVQCFDMRDQRPLRPFHCRATSSRPQAQLPCNLLSCLDWYTSSWGQVSQSEIMSKTANIGPSLAFQKGQI